MRARTEFEKATFIGFLNAGGSFLQRRHLVRRQRQPQTEGGAIARGGFEVHRTVMPLHDLVSLGEADATAGFLGSEIQLENLILDFWWDSGARVADLSHDRVVILFCRKRERAAFGHRL